MKLDITKMTSKGQVVIPQEIREEIGIKEGERFSVYDTEDSIILKRIKNLEEIKDIEEFEKTFKSMWKTAKSEGIKKEDIEKEIKTYRKGKHA